MKFLLLAQNNSPNVKNIISAFGQLNHDVDIVLYHEDGQQQCHVIEKDNGNLLSYKGREIDPKNYDGAQLWSWGTADIGRELLRVCEQAGIPVLNETSKTAVMDSKIKSAKLFSAALNVSFPKTVIFEQGSDAVQALKLATEKLGKGLYVFKADYGALGKGIAFIKSLENLESAISTLPKHNPGFLLQEFVGASDRPISHYRVIVSQQHGPINEAIKFTAQHPLHPSNGSAGGNAEFVPLLDKFRYTAVQATRISNLTFSGIDLMEDRHGNPVLLEVNDGPGTKRFDDRGHNASLLSVRDLIAKCEF